MPELDVTEVLLGADIAGTAFTVIRRREVVGSDGIAVLYQRSIPGVLGSVTPTGENSLIREEAHSAQHKSIMVVTSFRLRGSSRDGLGASWQPDLVLWRGGYFIVRTVEDFSQFGAGMISADCETFSYVPPPPQTPSVAIGRLDFRYSSNSSLGGGR